MKKIKLYLCTITGMFSFFFLIYSTEQSSSWLLTFIYIVLLSVTYLLAHSIKKDKRLSNMHKPRIKKSSPINKIIAFIRKLAGVLCFILAVSLFSTLFVDRHDFAPTICLGYTFALLTFVLLRKRTQKSSAVAYTEPEVSSAPESHQTDADTSETVVYSETTASSAPEIQQTKAEAPETVVYPETTVSSAPEIQPEQTKDSSIEAPFQPTSSSDNVIIDDRLNEALALLQSSLDQLNNITASRQAVTVKIDSTSPYPPEVLASMKTAYSQSQIDNDIRILNDCINIMNSTSNLETFFSRYETAMQKAFSLQMARDAGITVNTTITPGYISSFNSRAENVLEAAYAKELKEINSLKTPSGKRKRIDKFLSLLSEYLDEFEFSDVYNDIINELNMLKQTTKEPIDADDTLTEIDDLRHTE